MRKKSEPILNPRFSINGFKTSSVVPDKLLTPKIRICPFFKKFLLILKLIKYNQDLVCSYFLKVWERK